MASGFWSPVIGNLCSNKEKGTLSDLLLHLIRARLQVNLVDVDPTEL